MTALTQTLPDLTAIRIICLIGVMIGGIIVYLVLNIRFFGTSGTTDFVSKQRVGVPNPGRGYLFGLLEIGVASFFLIRKANEIYNWQLQGLAPFGLAALCLLASLLISMSIGVAKNKYKSDHDKSAENAIIISSPIFGLLAAGIAYFYNFI